MTRKPGASDETEDEREDPLYSYPALKVDQNGHLIYFTTIPIDDLFPYCFVERQNENLEQGYQRKFEERRANEIAEYLNTEGESIPSNIVLSAQEAAALTYTRKTKQLSYQRAKEAFSVIDGCTSASPSSPDVQRRRPHRPSHGPTVVQLAINYLIICNLNYYISNL